MLPLNGSPQDIAKGKLLALGSGSSFGASNYGVALQGSGSAAVASIPLDLSASPIASVSFWMYWNAYANDDDFAMEFTSNTYGGGQGFLLDPNSGAPSSGKFGVLVGRGTAVSGTQRSFTRPSAAAWHHYAAVLVYGQLTGSLSVPSVWVDGVSQTLSDDFGGGSQAGTAFPSDTLYLFSRANTSLFGAGRMFNLVVRSGYTLTQADVLTEYQQPWSLYEPRRIWVPVAAAGGSDAAISPASGATTASSLAGASTAETTVSAAAGASTASTIAGAATTAGAISAAAGASTASTLAGNATSAATLTAASGASTASTVAGASTAASAISAAAGVSTASTLTGVTGTGANIDAAAGVATASAMAGAATAASAISAATGAATASDIAGASTAAAAISAAAGAAAAGTLAGSTVGDSSAISPAAGVASTQIIVGASFAAAAIGAATGAATCSALVGGGGLVVLSAPPIGHGHGMSVRPSNAGGRRPSQASTRTR